MAKKFSFAEVFDPELCVISCFHGCAKPEHAFYKILLQQVKARVDKRRQEVGQTTPAKVRVVFMDDKEANVKAAKECGLDAFLYQAKKTTAEQLKAILAQHSVFV
jgi:FMN phosphatase YigB (HAD superfamily)